MNLRAIRRTSRAFLVLALASLFAAPASARAAPAVQLVESVPVESGLGNPALPAAHDVWLEMIQGATRSLDIEQFYISNWPGEPLQDVLDAIGVAAKRGVRVRLVLDAGMHRTYPQPADSLGKLPGIDLRILDMKPIAGGIQHAKFFLVDDREVFLGSQNFDWRALRHIHELGVRVRDARLTGIFRAVFDMDWDAAGGAPRRQASPAATPALPLRLAQARGDTVLLWPSYSPKGFLPDSTLWDEDALVRLLDSARREIVLQLLTYSPADRATRDAALDDALRRAAARGVHVRLLISDWEKGRDAMASLQSLVQVGGVEARLGTVPEWSGGYIPFARVEHCKYVVVDSLSTWVGTANWEPSYFHGSRNLAVRLQNRPLALQARQIFETSWRSPTAEPVNPTAHYEAKIRGETPPPGKKKYGG
jgi:phosphatidylserine/phosphatidylglycerophosphate/cardiolipin synthase-like enzyme